VFLVGSACGLAWAARLIHVGNLDAQALADKLGTPDPVFCSGLAGASCPGDRSSSQLNRRWCSC